MKTAQLCQYLVFQCWYPFELYLCILKCTRRKNKKQVEIPHGSKIELMNSLIDYSQFSLYMVVSLSGYIHNRRRCGRDKANMEKHVKIGSAACAGCWRSPIDKSLLDIVVGGNVWYTQTHTHTLSAGAITGHLLHTRTVPWQQQKKHCSVHCVVHQCQGIKCWKKKKFIRPSACWLPLNWRTRVATKDLTHESQHSSLYISLNRLCMGSFHFTANKNIPRR